MARLTSSEGVAEIAGFKARQNLLASLVHEALAARPSMGIRQESSGTGRNEGAQQAEKPSDGWDDPLAFIQAEEPDDAEWAHDDSIDTGAKPVVVFSAPTAEQEPQQPAARAEAADALGPPPMQMWSSEVFDDFEDTFMDWAGDEEPQVDLAEFDAVPVDAFDAAPDENILDWSQRFGIAHQDFVREVAIGIALKVGWNEIGVQVIARVLSPYRSFGKVRADLERFILGKRVSIRELLLVTALRSAWLEGGYCRGWVYRRNRFGTRPVDCKINLDWWLGLRLVRGLRTDDVEEVRLFLDDCFEEWTRLSSACTDIDLALMDHDSSELAATMHFHRYLHLILERMIGWPDSRRFPAFVDYRLFPREEGIRDCSVDGMDPLAELCFDD